jgi:hypothetical protein
MVQYFATSKKCSRVVTEKADTWHQSFILLRNSVLRYHRASLAMVVTISEKSVQRLRIRDSLGEYACQCKGPDDAPLQSRTLPIRLHLGSIHISISSQGGRSPHAAESPPLASSWRQKRRLSLRLDVVKAAGMQPLQLGAQSLWMCWRVLVILFIHWAGITL